MQMGKINQLFRTPVDEPVLHRLLMAFGIRDLADRRVFSKHDLVFMRTLDMLREDGVLDALREYYIPCKARVYLDDVTEKKAITVLKQVLRLHDHVLIARERNVNNHKVIFYHIAATQERHAKMARIMGGGTLRFD
jgi:hypothetical protein